MSAGTNMSQIVALVCAVPISKSRTTIVLKDPSCISRSANERHQHWPLLYNHCTACNFPNTTEVIHIDGVMAYGGTDDRFDMVLK